MCPPHHQILPAYFYIIQLVFQINKIISFSPKVYFFFIFSLKCYFTQVSFFPAELHLPHTSFSLLLLHSRSQMIFNNNFISSACVCLIRCSVMLQPMHSDCVANRSNKYFLHLLSNTRILELIWWRNYTFVTYSHFISASHFALYILYTHIYIYRYSDISMHLYISR